jgi:hypothetical protein
LAVPQGCIKSPRARQAQLATIGEHCCTFARPSEPRPFTHTYPEGHDWSKAQSRPHTCSPLNVSYIPLDKKNVPIGAMRNRAIKKAQHDIILFMDDDDRHLQYKHKANTGKVMQFRSNKNM